MSKPNTFLRAQVAERIKTLQEPFTASDLAEVPSASSILTALRKQGLIRFVGKQSRKGNGAKLKEYVRVRKVNTEEIYAPANLLEQHDKLPPRCTSWKQYDSWRELRPAAGLDGFCEDCTPEYQAEMCKVGRCDHPEILFYKDADGFIYGTQQIHNSKKGI